MVMLSTMPATGQTLLLVDDDPGVNNVLRSLLCKSGYHLLVASSGFEALDQIRLSREPIRLLITDLLMPGMSGQELVSKVHESHPDLRVLYISGFFEGPIPQSDDGPLSLYMSKPFDIKDFLRAVEMLLA